MKAHTNFALTLSIAVLGAFSSIAQSNTPCNGSGAPNIAVNTTCMYSTATISNSDSEQTNANNGGTPSCGSMGEDVWFSFTAPASGQVQIQTQAGTITDAVMAIYSGPCGSLVEIACNDDAATAMPELSATALTPGDTYFIRLWQYGGGTGSFDLCVMEITSSTPTNTDCSIPDPICSGSPITFTAQANGTEASTVDPGNNYDCLSTSPNPSWYYLEIANSGDLAIDITAGSDVDFALWGPYADLATSVANCGSHGLPVDCSYSTAAVEQANVTGAIAGEVYVLLVTNYANTVQTITVSDAPSNTATTDCSIVPLPVDFAAFDAVRQGEEVALNWMTASEKDNDHFILERSSDGQIWSAFDVIKGAGNSTSPLFYSATDRNPSTEINYYRIKQVDTDGSVRYSDVVSVLPYTSMDIQLTPNPANEKVIVTSSDSFSEVTIVNVQGAVLKTIEYSSVKQASIDLSGLKQGIYYVQLQSHSGTATERLIIR